MWISFINNVKLSYSFSTLVYDMQCIAIIECLYIHLNSLVHKTEVPGSVPSRACWPSRMDFSMIFSETHLNKV